MGEAVVGFIVIVVDIRRLPAANLGGGLLVAVVRQNFVFVVLLLR